MEEEKDRIQLEKEESKESRDEPLIDFNGMDPKQWEALSNPRKESIYDKTATGLVLKNQKQTVKQEVQGVSETMVFNEGFPTKPVTEAEDKKYSTIQVIDDVVVEDY